MARIAQNLKLDKRSKSVITSKVFATKVYLQYNNIHLLLSHVEAKRLAAVLYKAVSIQDTHRELKNSRP